MKNSNVSSYIDSSSGYKQEIKQNKCNYHMERAKVNLLFISARWKKEEGEPRKPDIQ